MNVTLADAEEVWTKKDNKRVELGRILLKGDNIVSACPFNQLVSSVANDICNAPIFSLEQTLIQPAK